MSILETLRGRKTAKELGEAVTALNQEIDTKTILRGDLRSKLTSAMFDQAPEAVKATKSQLREIDDELETLPAVLEETKKRCEAATRSRLRSAPL